MVVKKINVKKNESYPMPGSIVPSLTDFILPSFFFSLYSFHWNAVFFSSPNCSHLNYPKFLTFNLPAKSFKLTLLVFTLRVSLSILQISITRPGTIINRDTQKGEHRPYPLHVTPFLFPDIFSVHLKPSSL